MKRPPKEMMEPPRGTPQSSDWEAWDELARRVFNPDDMIDVVLTSGAVARVAPDASPETLAVLERMGVLMIEQAAAERP